MTATEWIVVTCAERDAMIADPDVAPFSGKADPDGVYGPPREVYTLWGMRGTDIEVLREWAFYAKGRDGGITSCKHEAVLR